MTWPPVFDGIGAMTVDASAFDPAALAAKIPGVTWFAQKMGGTDSGDAASRSHNADVWRTGGKYFTGVWVYCDGPPEHDVVVAQVGAPRDTAFVIYDVEREYKTDEGAPADYPARLVAAHKAAWPSPRLAAVTSYGAIPGYGNQPSSIDFQPFADAGWPILAQLYDSFKPGDEITYATDSGQPFPGPYPREGLHQLVRSLTLAPSMAVYRPEGIDG